MSERYDIHPADGRKGKYLSVPFLYSGVPDHSNAGKPEFRVWQWLQAGHRRRTGSWLLSFIHLELIAITHQRIQKDFAFACFCKELFALDTKIIEGTGQRKRFDNFSYYMLSGLTRSTKVEEYFYTDRFLPFLDDIQYGRFTYAFHGA